MTGDHSLRTPEPTVIEWSKQLAPDTQILDIAAGGGRHALWLTSLGHEVTAIDRDTSALEEAWRGAGSPTNPPILQAGAADTLTLRRRLGLMSECAARSLCPVKSPRRRRRARRGPARYLELAEAHPPPELQYARAHLSWMLGRDGAGARLRYKHVAALVDSLKNLEMDSSVRSLRSQASVAAVSRVRRASRAPALSSMRCASQSMALSTRGSSAPLLFWGSPVTGHTAT